MIGYDRYLAILAESDAAVRQGAEAAFVKLLEKIRAGAKPRAALDAVLKEFNADAIAGFREALNAILQSSLGNTEIKAYKVGRIKLSDALYANAQAVAGVSQQIIEKHMAGVHDARELRKALYEGYNFQDDPLKVVKPLPKYLQVEFDKFKAAALKTPALRAAYLEAIRKAEAGAGMDALEKVLKVAFYERNRYFANRIARTELHRNYTDQVARELMEEEEIEYVQIRMSSKHPKTDICDRHAKLDAYGLGPGVYPKADAPKPPFHPHCLPGDALITASGRITAVSKRWYDGDMAVITTTSGQQLTATINHPVLTPDGWVAIGALQVGHQVVCRLGGDGPIIGDHQHQHMPARIAEIADTFLSSRQVAAREVPLTTEDFHGDGIAGQIAVIGANRQLWDRFDALYHQAVEHNALVGAHESHALLSKGVFDFGLEAFGLPSHRCMSGFSPSFFEMGRSIGGFEPLSFNDSARLDALTVQPCVDSDSAGLQFLSDTQDGAPGQVFVDDVLGIEIKSWSGHVYNLETEQGHYTSNNIITHNCYCLVSPKIDIFNAKPRFNPKAEQVFLAQLPPKEARDIAGSWDKLARAKGGEPLEDIYNEGKDPLYRWRRVGDIMETPQVKAARLSSKAVDTALAEEEKRVIPARLRPVSQAFDFPDEPEYAPIRRALAAIDAAHDDGDLPPLPIELARDLTEGNDGEYWGDDAHAFKIRIAALSRSKEFSLACEVGHFLDHQALAPGQGYATLDPKGTLLDVLLSIQLSKSAQSIQSYAHDAKAYNYLNDETEWWSRAYAQWVALRGGSAILKKQADYAIHNEVGFWEWEDFDPIAKAIDQLFRQKGWL